MRLSVQNCFLALFLGLLNPITTLAQAEQDQLSGHDPNKILAYQGKHVISQNEIDGAFNRIPDNLRLGFIRDGNKVETLLTTLMVNKIMAADAYRVGIDQDPLVQERLKLAVEEELALIRNEQLNRNAPEADFDALAYEIYLAKQDEFYTQEVIDVSHILISTKQRDEDEASKLAESLKSQLDLDPSIYDEMIIEFSEDPSKDANKGHFPSVVRGQMVRSFERVAFRMTEPGEISTPVKSEFGFHIIRFNGRKEPRKLEFDRVKERLVVEARSKNQKNYHDTYLLKLLSDPLEFPDGALEIMVKRYFGENLELAPTLGAGEDGESK
ncbi:MAG: peptidyl-prolyl cis-trans isomerase C [Lysobacterales bacterium]|jgi:peptidyl-prolyl cis-trans isomerase C